MAKYTIEVDGLYALGVLSPLVELMSPDPDKEEIQSYLTESLPLLFDVLHSALDGYNEECADEWAGIAAYAEGYAKAIRDRLAAAGLER